MLLNSNMLYKERERMSHDKLELDLQTRKTVGKGLNALRRSGQVPAVIHDHGKDSIIVQGEYMSVYKTVNKAGKNHPIAVSVGGKKYTTLVKDVSLDPRKGTFTHIVFNAVNANETVTAEVPLHAKYDEDNDSSPAERAGLIVLHNVEVVEVESLPANLPDMLYFDGEKLVEPGDQLTVDDLEVPKNVVIRTDETTVIATVFEPSALAAANDSAGGDAEPGDEANVESEHESSAEEGAQTDE
jgi:large subunit ribosomal protein L25